MNRFTFSTLLLGIILAPNTTPAQDAAAKRQQGRVVVGYVPHYRLGKLDPKQIEGVTDLIYFGIVPTTDGSLPEPVIDPTHLTKLTKIRKSNGCRILLSVGGWDRSIAFPVLTSNDAAQTRFINNLLDFCRNNHFAGVDYDWEHPKDAAELAHYSALISKTKAAFSDAELLVTVAQASWQNLGKNAYTSVDRIHLMSYDHDFPQATLAKTTADVEKLITWGCSPDKIAVGIPFYGRSKAGGTKTYQAIASQPGVDLASNDYEGFAFNGPELVTAKCKLAQTKGLAGVMIWELGQDAVGHHSLLDCIREPVSVESE